MKITLIIPAYNESKQIGELLTELDKLKYSYIVVDDGSKDNTFTIAKKHHGLVLKHRVNLGKGAAMKTGAEIAFMQHADAIIFMDADGQHLVSDLPHFINALKKGEQLVLGSRNLSYGVPLVRYMGNKLAALIISLLFGVYVSDILCGFRAMTKDAYLKAKWGSRDYAVETEIIIRAAQHKIKYCEVPVTTLYYDKFKGVTILDSLHILFSVIRWRINL
jgi:glycosyltransferase involved in cell wall biosynthesis